MRMRMLLLMMVALIIIMIMMDIDCSLLVPIARIAVTLKYTDIFSACLSHSVLVSGLFLTELPSP